MTNEKILPILEGFRELSIEEQTTIIDLLTMTRQQLVSFLGIKNHHVDIKMKAGELEPIYFGIFLTSAAETIKGEKQDLPVKLNPKQRKVWKDIQKLSLELQADFIKEVTLSRKAMEEALGITYGALNLLLTKGRVHSVKKGIFLKAEAERRNQEKSYKNQSTGYFTKEMALAALREAADELGESFTSEEYESWIKNHPDHPSVPTIQGMFSGGITEAMTVAELRPVYQRGMSRKMEQEDKEEHCIQALIAAANSNGVDVKKLLQPQYIEWRKSNSSYPSFATIVNVLGGWKGGKEKAAAFIEATNNKERE